MFELLSRLNRAQQSRGFQWAASAVVLAAMVIGFGWLLLRTPPAPLLEPGVAEAAQAQPETSPKPLVGNKAIGADNADKAAAGEDAQAKQGELGVSEDERSTLAIVNDVVSARADSTALGVGIALGGALALAVIWLGLGILYLALSVVAVGALRLGPVLHVPAGYVAVAVGVMLLTAVFAALMQLARLLTSYSLWMLLFGVVSLLLGVAAGITTAQYAPASVAGPVSVLVGMAVFAAAFVPLLKFSMTMQPGAVAAIARNTLAEAVRLKLSVVFLVLLVIGLAALPQLLDPKEFLRYRVQSFLQYGMGGSFWLIGLLVLLFAVASVAFDQRDKTIWQTMTKPVSAAQYVLGKWLGVAMLAAVLMTVCGSGVYLFTEYLRNQTASNEIKPYVAEEGRLISEDRLILETQVLSARDTVQIEPWEIDEAKFRESVSARVNSILEESQVPGETEVQRDFRRSVITSRITSDLRKTLSQAQRVIGPGESSVYRFSGLAAAKQTSRPLVLRYKINSGGNMPDVLYRITFQFKGALAEVREVPLAQTLTIPLLPSVVDDEGNVEVQVTNGDVFRGSANPESLSFPPDGLEITYAAGSFRTNFLRVVGVLWVKLAFLAMVGVVAGTFLSFPVACLVSLTIFFSAEGASFTRSALDNYSTEDQQGKPLIFRTIISKVAEAVSGVFQVYSDLKPTAHLVEGLRLGWGDAAMGVASVALATMVLYVIGVIVMKRRELAIYSGQ